MPVITEIQRLGFGYAQALHIWKCLMNEVPRAIEYAKCETLYRPENRLADLAIRLNVPREWAKHFAYCALEESGLEEIET